MKSKIFRKYPIPGVGVVIVVRTEKMSDSAEEIWESWVKRNVWLLVSVDAGCTETQERLQSVFKDRGGPVMKSQFKCAAWLRHTNYTSQAAIWYKCFFAQSALDKLIPHFIRCVVHCVARCENCTVCSRSLQSARCTFKRAREVHTRQSVVIRKWVISLLIMNDNNEKKHFVFQQLTHHSRNLWGRYFQNGIQNIFDASFFFCSSKQIRFDAADQSTSMSRGLKILSAAAMASSQHMTQQNYLSREEKCSKKKRWRNKTTCAQFCEPGKRNDGWNLAE